MPREHVLLAAGRLPAFELESYFSRWEFTARHLLCASDVRALRLNDLLRLADPEERAAWESQALGYTHPRGSPELREAIAATYDRIRGDDVVCFASAGEGIFAAMHTLLAPDDHAITVVPCYQSLESLPRSLCATTAIPLDPTDDWALDLDRVRQAIRPTTRLIAINIPHNPTGTIFSRETLDGLIALARRYGVYLLCDEVFRGVERRPEQRLPQVADLYERGLSIGALSKSYGLPGLRISWVACREPEVLARLEALRHYMSLCNARPSELLAMIALRARAEILRRNLRLIQRNLTLLDAFFAEHAERFEWRAPEGGCVGYVRYLGAEGVETFVETLVERTGVLLLPASVFRSELGPTPPDRFRIGYGRAGLEEGLAILSEYLRGQPFLADRGRGGPAWYWENHRSRHAPASASGRSITRATEGIQIPERSVVDPVRTPRASGCGT